MHVEACPEMSRDGGSNPPASSFALLSRVGVLAPKKAVFCFHTPFRLRCALFDRIRRIPAEHSREFLSSRFSLQAITGFITSAETGNRLYIILLWLALRHGLVTIGPANKTGLPKLWLALRHGLVTI